MQVEWPIVWSLGNVDFDGVGTGIASLSIYKIKDSIAIVIVGPPGTVVLFPEYCAYFLCAGLVVPEAICTSTVFVPVLKVLMSARLGRVLVFAGIRS